MSIIKWETGLIHVYIVIVSSCVPSVLLYLENTVSSLKKSIPYQESNCNWQMLRKGKLVFFNGVTLGISTTL